MFLNRKIAAPLTLWAAFALAGHTLQAQSYELSGETTPGSSASRPAPCVAGRRCA